ncbi:MAG: PAS domain S-box protein [Bacillota bacterium]|nr:PAS domain S-box protein [Bacillota bacterium]
MFYVFQSNILDVSFLCVIAIWINYSLNKKYSPYFLGVMFGLITIIAMNGRIMMEGGHYYDFRHITMTMAGFIGGPITAVIAAILSSLYRYIFVGTASMGGITSIIVFACFGTILGKYVENNRNVKRMLFWLIIGAVMAFIFLFIIAMGHPWEGNFPKVLREFCTPFLVLTSLLTTILFNFYFWTYEFFGKASILNTILKSSPLNLIILNDQGPVLLSKNLINQHQSCPFIENPNLLLSPDKSELSTTTQQHKELSTEDGRQFATNLSSFQMPSGEYACVAIVNDVTDRKKEQEKLRGATDRFSKAFQLGPHMMAIIRKSDSRYIYVNDRFLEERDFTLDDVLGKTPIEIGFPENEFKAIMKTIEAHGSIRNVECSLVTKFGSTGTAILSAETINMDEQECILFAYNDVTEMKRMQTEKVEQLTRYLALEADLSRSNQLIADIIQHMPDEFYVLDPHWRFTFVNKKSEELFEKTREELLGNVLWKIIPFAQGSLLERNYRKAIIDYEPVTFETLCLRKKDRWYQVTAYPSKVGLSVYYRDITERKLARDNLLKSQKETVSILESMTDCFVAVDSNLQYTYVNHAGEIAFGKSRDEMLGKKMTDIYKVNDTVLLNFHEAINERKSLTFEILSEALGNKWLEISAYSTETGLTCFFRDITSRKIALAEMARLDRLNLVGQLAAGIGHEIRNPMTTVRGYLQLLGTKPEYEAQDSTFKLMISELDRANSIITEFLSLAQTKKNELKPRNLNNIFNDLYPLLEADAFTQNKQVRFIPGDIPNLELNVEEITQLILNLSRNGLEAMKENGCLTILSYLDNDKVVFAIKDEGCGIPPDNITKLGTPFFTTKDNGTGLGLATCYKIAESHNAKICVNSTPRGTTFLIYFPIPNKKRGKNDMIA